VPPRRRLCFTLRELILALGVHEVCITLELALGGVLSYHAELDGTSTYEVCLMNVALETGCVLIALSLCRNRLIEHHALLFDEALIWHKGVLSHRNRLKTHGRAVYIISDSIRVCVFATS
jgi:hypothetical protein